MQIHFTNEQETQLEELARRDGKSSAAELLKEIALRMLSEVSQFQAAVREGKAYADRGEFLEEAEVDARFEEILRA